MCLHIRNIKNKTRLFYRDLTSYRLNVPCGKCEECQNNKTDEWLVRLAYEMKSYQSSGGIVVFPTLTYNESNVPWYTYYDCVGEPHHVRVFRPHDKDLFFKRLRRFFERVGFVPRRVVDGVENDYNSELGIKYMVASEFGSDELYRDSHGNMRRGTSRPHYHALIFFPKWVVDRYSLEDLNHIIQACWIVKGTNLRRFKVGSCRWNIPEDKLLGEVRYSVDDDLHTMNMTIKNTRGIRYVAKYMAKDFSFFKHAQIKPMLEYMWREACSISHDNEDAINLYNSFINEYLPRHFQSMNLGHEICDTINEDPSVLNYGLDMSKFENFKKHVEIDKNGKNYRYPVPRIFRNRSIYEQIPVGFNQDGEEVKKRFLRNKFYLYLSDNLRNKIDYKVKELRAEMKDRVSLSRKLNVDDSGCFVDGLSFNSFCLSYDNIKEDLDLYFAWKNYFQCVLLRPCTFAKLKKYNSTQLYDYILKQSLQQDSLIYPDIQVLDKKYHGVFDYVEELADGRSLAYDSNNNFIPSGCLPQFAKFNSFDSYYTIYKNYVTKNRIAGYNSSRKRSKNFRDEKSTKDKRYSQQQSRKYSYV